MLNRTMDDYLNASSVNPGLTRTLYNCGSKGTRSKEEQNGVTFATHRLVSQFLNYSIYLYNCQLIDDAFTLLWELFGYYNYICHMFRDIHCKKWRIKSPSHIWKSFNEQNLNENKIQNFCWNFSIEMYFKFAISVFGIGILN